MGAWGAGIFSDDLACDVREDWREFIADGKSPREATDALIAKYVNDPPDDEDHVFWLALAVSQWKTGRLVDDVRDRALAVIDSGKGLDPWRDAADRSKRERVLAQTREQLWSEQPHPTRIRKRAKSATPFGPGDVLAYRHGDGYYVVFWVLSNFSDRGGEYNHTELLDYASEQLPDLTVVGSRPALPYYWRCETEPLHHDIAGIALISADKIKSDRIVLLGRRHRPGNRGKVHCLIPGKGGLDGLITQLFNERAAHAT
jgi:hypothetical protein